MLGLSVLPSAVFAAQGDRDSYEFTGNSKGIPYTTFSISGYNRSTGSGEHNSGAHGFSRRQEKINDWFWHTCTGVEDPLTLSSTYFKPDGQLKQMNPRIGRMPEKRWTWKSSTAAPRRMFGRQKSLGTIYSAVKDCGFGARDRMQLSSMELRMVHTERRIHFLKNNLDRLRTFLFLLKRLNKVLTYQMSRCERHQQ